MENITSFVQSIFLSFCVAPRKKKFYWKWITRVKNFFFGKMKSCIAKTRQQQTTPAVSDPAAQVKSHILVVPVRRDRTKSRETYCWSR
jgi:hypothetical protein